MPYNNVLHFSAYQNHYRAPLLHKFKKKNVSTFATCKFFVSEISLTLQRSPIKFYENPSAGSRTDTSGRSYARRDMTKVIVAFRDFAVVPKSRVCTD